MEKNLGCVREKTVRDYIYDLGRTELAHDYKAEVKRIIAMLDEKEREYVDVYGRRIAKLEMKIEELEIINSCLAKCVKQMRDIYEI